MKVAEIKEGLLDLPASQVDLPEVGSGFGQVGAIWDI